MLLKTVIKIRRDPLRNKRKEETIAEIRKEYVVIMVGMIVVDYRKCFVVVKVKNKLLQCRNWGLSFGLSAIWRRFR